MHNTNNVGHGTPVGHDSTSIPEYEFRLGAGTDEEKHSHGSSSPSQGQGGSFETESYSSAHRLAAIYEEKGGDGGTSAGSLGSLGSPGSLSSPDRFGLFEPWSDYVHVVPPVLGGDNPLDRASLDTIVGDGPPCPVPVWVLYSHHARLVKRRQRRIKRGLFYSKRR